MGGLNTIQHSSSVRRQFKFFTSPSMLCATCGGAILVLNFLTLCIFSSKLLHLHFPNIYLLCEPVFFSCIFPIFSFCAHQATTRSLNAELGLLICCFVFFSIFSQIASVAFSRYLFAQYNIVFVLTSDKKFER